MLKVLGSMLILLASVGFGFQIQMDLKNHLRLLYDIRKLLLDIANETAYTMDSMEVVLEHSIHSRNPYLNEICREMGEGLQKKERGCGQELWQERIEAWQKTLESIHFGGERNFCRGRMRLFRKKHGRK